ncbi:hypothetical protein SNEBB_010537 [Seison nebaliae]|nr:hypothetical protein SNEBB_010537 [Seison nebaliae]
MDISSSYVDNLTDSLEFGGHLLQKKKFQRPVYCHQCQEIVWGLLCQGYQCDVCNFICHDRCQKFIVIPCTNISTWMIKNPVVHVWCSILSTAKKRFCNVCRKKFEDEELAYKCDVCHYWAHKHCQPYAVCDCRPTAEYKQNMTREKIEHGHLWREGNLPPQSKCVICRKQCHSPECLSGIKCEWCSITAHINCLVFRALESKKNLSTDNNRYEMRVQQSIDKSTLYNDNKQALMIDSFPTNQLGKKTLLGHRSTTNMEMTERFSAKMKQAGKPTTSKNEFKKKSINFLTNDKKSSFINSKITTFGKDDLCLPNNQSSSLNIIDEDIEQISSLSFLLPTNIPFPCNYGILRNIYVPPYGVYVPRLSLPRAAILSIKRLVPKDREEESATPKKHPEIMDGELPSSMMLCNGSSVIHGMEVDAAGIPISSPNFLTGSPSTDNKKSESINRKKLPPHSDTMTNCPNSNRTSNQDSYSISNRDSKCDGFDNDLSEVFVQDNIRRRIDHHYRATSTSTSTTTKASCGSKLDLSVGTPGLPQFMSSTSSSLKRDTSKSSSVLVDPTHMINEMSETYSYDLNSDIDQLSYKTRSNTLSEGKTDGNSSIQSNNTQYKNQSNNNLKTSTSSEQHSSTNLTDRQNYFQPQQCQCQTQQLQRPQPSPQPQTVFIINEDNADEVKESFYVFDGNDFYPNVEHAKEVSVRRNASLREILNVCLRTFQIFDERHMYYMSVPIHPELGAADRPVGDHNALKTIIQAKRITFVRYKDADTTGVLRIFSGLADNRTFENISVRNNSTTWEVLKYVLSAFQILPTYDRNEIFNELKGRLSSTIEVTETTITDEIERRESQIIFKFSLILASINNEILPDKPLDYNDYPLQITRQIRQESLKKYRLFRLVLQDRTDPNGTCISLFIGNLPIGLSQLHYTHILQNLINNNTIKWTRFDVIFYEHGAVVIQFDEKQIGALCYEMLQSKKWNGNKLCVLILPTILPFMLDEDIVPLCVFVNVKSGGQQGLPLINAFRHVLNPHQIFDLQYGGPLPGLYVFRHLKKYRILVCGGDGTVGWVLQCLDNVGQDALCQSPPMAIIPLGTGNDLARVLRWGGGLKKDHNNDQTTIKLLSAVINAEEVTLDRWTVMIHQDEKDDTKRFHHIPLSIGTKNSNAISATTTSTTTTIVNPSTTHVNTINNLSNMTNVNVTNASNSSMLTASVAAAAAATTTTTIPKEDTSQIIIMNNYFGLGADAEVALEFHNAREENPKKFKSRLHNKRMYFNIGIRKLTTWHTKKLCSNLRKQLSLVVDNKHINIPSSVVGIIILNIWSWMGGANLWGTSNSTSTDGQQRFNVPALSDGMLEVVGLYGIVHMGQIYSGMRNGIRLAQGSHIKIRIHSELPVQVDGEPWVQQSSSITILRSALRATMLKKSKSKKHRHNQLGAIEQTSIVEKEDTSVTNDGDSISLGDQSTYVPNEEKRMKEGKRTKTKKTTRTTSSTPISAGVCMSNVHGSPSTTTSKFIDFTNFRLVAKDKKEKLESFLFKSKNYVSVANPSSITCSNAESNCTITSIKKHSSTSLSTSSCHNLSSSSSMSSIEQEFMSTKSSEIRRSIKSNEAEDIDEILKANIALDDQLHSTSIDHTSIPDGHNYEDMIELHDFPYKKKNLRIFTTKTSTDI